MTTKQPTGGASSRPRVGGRYELSGLLGRGGMAEVREGHDLRLGRRVAVKRLRSDLASDSTFQARFRREAQSAASLNHPSIVAVYDTGEEEPADGSGTIIPYIVMEYVEGRTLRDILREGRKILPERALEITADVLSALDYSHRAGIVHRDIKPANVMLTPAGEVKVMDFGIARALADSSSTMTQTAAVVGTAQYLSPEQARGEQVDARSDLYSTGVLLFELLTGRPPFVGDSPVAVAYQHVREEPPAPSEFDPEISPELDAICAKALAKSTADRYQNATEMRADIERALAGQPVLAPAAVGATMAAGQGTSRLLPYGAGTTDTATVPPIEQEQKKNRRRGWLLALAALAALLLLVLAAVFLPGLLSSTDGPTETTVPTVTGLKLREAERQLESERLRVGDIERRFDDDAPRGEVIQQSPEPGEVAPRRSEVDLVVSKGPPRVAVPSVVGLTADEAEAKLRKDGFDVESFYTESDESRNLVVDSDPESGVRAIEGSTVTLSLSDGPEPMPDVVGDSQSEAEAEISELGIDVDVREDTTDSVPEGTVTQQFPAPGSDVDAGDTAIIFVAVEPEEPTPSPKPKPKPTPTPSPSPSPTPTQSSPPPDEESPTSPFSPTPGG
jgi:eukaryotic-like serine/threonine-protein kinase